MAIWGSSANLEKNDPFTKKSKRQTNTTSAMYIKSSIPVQAKVPECNAYEALWNRHDQAKCPDDLIIHIEGASGKKRTYQELRTCAVLAATALDRALNAENAEMIAIISQSSSVRVRERKVLQQ